MHYYAPDFDGVVVGTEDVLITPSTCDRIGSGDAVVAGILRKLITHSEMYTNQDYFGRQPQLRFAIAAGVLHNGPLVQLEESTRKVRPRI
ncbi:hypothetical protein MLD38_013917 [Melastoma candidum]|uniref:Uncharacterized protein n=1 Tax=Melastoma candidum TaxID=119954 RepID=A0ACB9RAH6_9MYRT|nr:hypothetical protein MLD38_013917 [Melastoma candidum]